MSAEQTKLLEQTLRPIAARQRQADLRPKLVRSLLLGGALALVPALLKLATGNTWWGVAAVVLLLCVPIAVLARTFARRLDLRKAALAVDRHYQWQDRMTTAWSALSVGGLTPLEQYVAADAARRVPQVSPGQVVPLKLPRRILAACVLAAVVLCALLWPIRYDKPRPVKPAETTIAAEKPTATTIPSVSPEVAQSSLSQIDHDRSQHASLPAPLAPDRRLIHDYFEAVCPPPGR